MFCYTPTDLTCFKSTSLTSLSASLVIDRSVPSCRTLIFSSPDIYSTYINNHLFVQYNTVSGTYIAFRAFDKIIGIADSPTKQIEGQRLWTIISTDVHPTRLIFFSAPHPHPPPPHTHTHRAVLLLWFLTVIGSCCPYLYFGSPIILVPYFSSV